MTNFANIGNRIKELRGTRPMKLFAAELKISFAAYQNYEYGKRVPPGTVLSRLSEVGGKSVDWILTGEEKADRVREVRSPYLTTSDKITEIVNALPEKDRKAVLEFAEFKRDKKPKEDLP